MSIKKYIRENNFDVKFMNQLLQHELLYMETYNQLQEAQEKIATLEQQLNDKNNKDKSLNIQKCENSLVRIMYLMRYYAL